jgi:hypothetical protein
VQTMCRVTGIGQPRFECIWRRVILPASGAPTTVRPGLPVGRAVSATSRSHQRALWPSQGPPWAGTGSRRPVFRVARVRSAQECRTAFPGPVDATATRQRLPMIQRTGNSARQQMLMLHHDHCIYHG